MKTEAIYLTQKPRSPYARSMSTSELPLQTTEQSKGEKSPNKKEVRAVSSERVKAAVAWEKFIKQRNIKIDPERLKEMVGNGIGPAEYEAKRLRQRGDIIEKKSPDEKTLRQAWENDKRASKQSAEEMMKKGYLPEETVVVDGKYVGRYDQQKAQALWEGIYEINGSLSDFQQKKIMLQVAKGYTPLDAYTRVVGGSSEKNAVQDKMTKSADEEELRNAKPHTASEQDGFEPRVAHEVFAEGTIQAYDAASDQQEVHADAKEFKRAALEHAWEEALGDDWDNKDTQVTVQMAIDMGLAPDAITSQAKDGEVEQTAKEVIKNSLLSDEDRIKKAAEVLGRPIQPWEREPILNAHYVGVDRETGKMLLEGKNGKKAGVFNYKQEQLGEKVGELKKAINPESGEMTITADERRKLIEAGVAAAPFTPEKEAEYTRGELAPIIKRLKVELARTGTDNDNPIDQDVVRDLKRKTMEVIDRNLDDDALLGQANSFLKTLEEDYTPSREGWYQSLNEIDKHILDGRDLKADDPNFAQKSMREWVNYRMTQLYTVARKSDVGRHELFEDTRRAFAEALRYKGLDSESQRILTDEFKTRVNLLIMDSAMATKNKESYVPASQGLRTDGLFKGYTLEDGRVSSMVNRIDEKLDDLRIEQKHKRITQEILTEVENTVIEEHLRYAKNRTGEFAESYYSEATDKKIEQAINNRGQFRETWKKILADSKIPDPEKNDALRRKIMEAEITNVYRTAYDIVVSNQRMAVLSSRSTMLRLADKGKEDLGDVWASDPGSTFTSYNPWTFFYGKWNYTQVADFEMMEEVQKSLVRQYMEENNYKETELTEHQKYELGMVLFRDLGAPGDLFNSSWRYNRMLAHMQEYFGIKNADDTYKFRDQLAVKGYNVENPEDLKKYSEEFALFMRVPDITKDGVGAVNKLKEGKFEGTAEEKRKAIEDAEKKRDKSRDHWEKIVRYRPEEVTKLVVDRLGRDHHDHLAGELEHYVFGDSNYQEFKKEYGYAIRAIREMGFRGDFTAEGYDVGKPQLDTGLSEQIDFTNLTGSQLDKLNELTGGNAAVVIDRFQKMKDFITDHHIVPTGDGQSVIERNVAFADVYNTKQPRALVVDDALIGTLQRNDVNGMLLSARLGGSEELANDSYYRMIGDISAGEGDEGYAMEMLKYLQATTMEEKFKHAQAAANASATYASIDGKADILYHTQVPYLLAGRIPRHWEVIGLEHNPLGYRKPVNRLQEIYGPHADAFTRDRLRHELDLIEKELEYGAAHIVAEIEALDISDAEKKSRIKKVLEEKKKNIHAAERILGITKWDMYKKKAVDIMIFLAIAAFIESIAQAAVVVQEGAEIAGGGGGGHGGGH